MNSKKIIYGLVFGISVIVGAKVGVDAFHALAERDSKSDPDSVASEQNTTSKVVVEQTVQATKPDLWPARAISPNRDPILEKRLAKILAKMSLEEKVGQIIQPELKYVTPKDVRDYHLGSVLNGGGTTPNNDKHASLDDWVALAEVFYQASMDTSDGRIAIPLIWGTDAVHGNNNLYGATLFPHNIGLGAANDPDMMQKIGAATALEVTATGINWTFGPTVAVVRDIRWGRTYESYSEDPKIVSLYARQMVNGIQGIDNIAGRYRSDKVVATAKHFLGDGGTFNGIDRGDTIVDESELRNIHGAGYITALDSNVLTTMASFNSWNGVKLHGHKYLLTDILKDRMGFDGFVVGDWNGHRQVPGCTVERCPQSINAGLDMFMVPEDWKALYNNTLQDVKNGDIAQSRLDDAVSRILRVKLHVGLFDAGPVRQRENVGDQSLVGNVKHRELAREAVRKSLVLLKNNDELLPLSSKSNVLVAGAGADNISMQAGGWTLTWQGTGNTNDDFPGATSIFAGIEEAVSKAGGSAVLRPNGEWSPEHFPGNSQPDAAIIVFGEEPYAEWHGDLGNIEYQRDDKSNLTLLKKLESQGIPVISVFLSGRPLWVNKELNASDAFIAAWLPGSEGAGLADLLIASDDESPPFDFQGKLSFSWPKYANQAKLNVGQDDYDPLFPFGYGLSYQQPKEVANDLSESTLRRPNDALDELWLFVSRANSPWQIQLKDDGGAEVAVGGNSASSSDDNNLELSSIDKVSQEDARRLTWQGLRAAEYSLRAKMPQDLSEYLSENSELSFAVRVDKAPEGLISLGLNCVSENCTKEVPLDDFLAGLTVGEWTNASVAISCFATDKTSLNSVKDIFVLRSKRKASLSLADIKLVPKGISSASSSVRIDC